MTNMRKYLFANVNSVGSRYIKHSGTKPEIWSNYEPIEDVPYLTLTGEPWGIFSGCLFTLPRCSRCRHVVLRCPELCFAVATQQPLVSFGVYKPSGMWNQIDFGSQSLSGQHAEKETNEAEVRHGDGPVGHGKPRN